MSTFEIDILEICFLAEACMNPGTIARHSFWMDLCEKHHHKMSMDERDKIFYFITRNLGFNLDNKDNQYFYARFNKDNQYRVQTEFEGKTGWNECFLYNGKYSINERTWIPEEYIIKVEKL
jgi:hypothetical protein